ncbi:MAG: rhodanese-like domain-containing protein [Myxococcales bacterium]|nr:rhodanese-like domain-containing protein [Myxococcales bacterium]MDD9965585.1 rhodanese-like domain-containing protein [Myxococcales bacterium]
MSFVAEQAATIVDVREPHEFVGELGHVEGAENVPLSEIAQAALDWRFDQPLLFVCRSGRRSRGVCDQLVKRGFRNVVNLRDGMLGYRKATSL